MDLPGVPDLLHFLLLHRVRCVRSHCGGALDRDEEGVAEGQQVRVVCVLPLPCVCMRVHAAARLLGLACGVGVVTVGARLAGVGPTDAPCVPRVQTPSAVLALTRRVCASPELHSVAVWA
jgi:hypothetical protein